MKITASLVLFHNNPDIYELSIKSFVNSCDGVMYVVDNSSEPSRSNFLSHPRVRYLYSGNNLGFGAAHNLAFAAINPESNFHLILNPDISFSSEVLPHLIDLMQCHSNIGVVMPSVKYPDGSLQHLCKLLPTPVDLILRRFCPVKAVIHRINRRYELHCLPRDHLVDVPTVSGCFLLVRTKLLLSLGGFDERYFMYLEDVDLVRRIGDVARVVCDPRVSVTHAYAKGSYRNMKLLCHHIISGMRYFTKWGWWFDSERRRRNVAALSLFRQL